MEKIKVNMSPNPLDVQTIHASQNDGEARQWGFELHNNGDVIDSSEVTDQMVFKAYKGGTEEILPTNGSVPATSPFKGDIKYPQGLLNDQEFTYRESPTESGGLAKITDVKGNTLVWNQLIRNGNFASTDDWMGVNASFSVSNNMATFTASARYGRVAEVSDISLVQGHKYLHKVDVKTSAGTTYMQLQVRSRNETGSENVITTDYTTNWQTLSSIFTAQETGNVYLRAVETAPSDFVTVNLKNWMLIDLTQMGLDSLTVEEFTSLFPLSYYSYNQGSLLSFNGNGIKTVGFNQWDEEIEQGGINATTGATAGDSIRSRSVNFIPVLPNTQYYCYNMGGSLQPYYYDAEQNYIGYDTANISNATFTTPSDCHFFKFRVRTDSIPFEKGNICINISSSRNGEYEPYTSSTLSLPISTYFPNGMKSAGSVYDELTPRKAITRIGAVDLGSLTWSYERTNTSGLVRMTSTGIRGLVKKPSSGSISANILCPLYSTKTADQTYLKNVGISINTSGTICIYDENYNTTDKTSAFKTAMSGVYLYYELATPTETSFTTASLVTENAEIPLSNNDGVLIGKCTEELSENPGFIDAKIKLSDSDGECYSNKLQLHVERSPQ